MTTAKHPYLSGIAGFVLAPLAVGTLARLFIPKSSSVKEVAAATGAAHAIGAALSWVAMERLDGDSRSAAKGALVGEISDAIFAPSAILAADAIVKGFQLKPAAAQYLPGQPSAPAATPATIAPGEPNPTAPPAPAPSSSDPLGLLGFPLRTLQAVPLDPQNRNQVLVKDPMGGSVPLALRLAWDGTDLQYAFDGQATSGGGSDSGSAYSVQSDAGDGVYLVPHANSTLTLQFGIQPDASPVFALKVPRTAAAAVSGVMRRVAGACAPKDGKLPPLSSVEQTIAGLRAAMGR